MYGFTLAISCCVKISNIPSKFVKYIDGPLFKAVTMELDVDVQSAVIKALAYDLKKNSSQHHDKDSSTMRQVNKTLLCS